VIEQFTLRQTIDTFRSIYLELSAFGSAATPATADDEPFAAVGAAPVRSATG
jgi:hypothetical protein